MADTDWNLHSKQLITPVDEDRMLLEPSDETAKAVEVGGFRTWLMNTALFNTLTTTAKNIIGAIEEVKGIADNNTTQLNANTQDFNNFKNFMVKKGVDINYYVSTTGDDNNDGSQATPFRTLQKAFDMLPRILMLNAFINVLDGEYEVLSCYAMTGNGALTLQSASGNRDNVKINGLNITHCSNFINVLGVTINRKNADNISVSSSSKVKFENVILDGDISHAGLFSEYSNVYITQSVINNQAVAIKSFVCNNILAQTISGTGNITGLEALYGGVIAKDNITELSATTLENAGLGGEIR